jgi:hypothetical protein
MYAVAEHGVLVSALPGSAEHWQCIITTTNQPNPTRLTARCKLNTHVKNVRTSEAAFNRPTRPPQMFPTRNLQEKSPFGSRNMACAAPEPHLNLAVSFPSQVPSAGFRFASDAGRERVPYAAPCLTARLSSTTFFFFFFVLPLVVMGSKSPSTQLVFMPRILLARAACWETNFVSSMGVLIGGPELTTSGSGRTRLVQHPPLSSHTVKYPKVCR